MNLPTTALDLPETTEPTGESPPHHRAIKSFVLRAGRMGSGQVRAMEELGTAYVLPYAAQPLDAAQAFGRSAPLVLEIGFGMGDATAAIAAALHVSASSVKQDLQRCMRALRSEDRLAAAARARSLGLL